MFKKKKHSLLVLTLLAVLMVSSLPIMSHCAGWFGCNENLGIRPKTNPCPNNFDIEEVECRWVQDPRWAGNFDCIRNTCD